MLDGGFELACPPNNHEFFFAAISVSNNLTEKAGLFLFLRLILDPIWPWSLMYPYNYLDALILELGLFYSSVLILLT